MSAVACGFGGVCTVVANESGRCPRHAFLVAKLGEERALHAEYGFACGQCGVRAEESELAECKGCGREGICRECREDGTCCIDDLLEDDDEWDDDDEDDLDDDEED